MGSVRRWCQALVLAYVSVCVACFPITALAAVGTPGQWDYGFNRGQWKPLPLNTATPPGFTRFINGVMSGGAATGEVVARDAIKAAIGQAEVAVNGSRSIPWASIGRVATIAGRTFTPIAVGATVYGAWKLSRCRLQGGVANGDIVCDDGDAPQQGQPYTGPVWWDGLLTSPQLKFSSLSGACTDSMNRRPLCVNGNGKTGCSVSLTAAGSTGDPNRCFFHYTYSDTNTAQCGGPNQPTCFQQRDDVRDMAKGTGTLPPEAPTCPGYVDPFDPAYSVSPGSLPGPDGKCAAGRYTTKTETQVADRIAAVLPKTDAENIVKEALQRGTDLSPLTGPGTLTGPATAPGPATTTTTQNPDGSTSTKTEQTQYNVTYNGDSYTYNTSNVTNNGGTVTTETGDKVEVEVCGLPGKPACKIDEAGTPTTDGLADAKTTVDGIMQPVKDAIASPSTAFPKLPDINWTFALPTACGIIPTPFFGEFLEGIDVCQFQGVFHDLMSMVWIVGGLFGARDLFFRDQMSGA